MHTVPHGTRILRADFGTAQCDRSAKKAIVVDMGSLHGESCWTAVHSIACSDGRRVGRRIKHGYNQKQLAQKIGVSQQHISKIEHGDFANVMTLAKVILAIGYTFQLRIIRLKPKLVTRIDKILRSKTNIRLA